MSLETEATSERRGQCSPDLLLASFDASPHPMWIYDPDTLRLVRVNDAALARFGYSREEFLNLTVADVFTDGATVGRAKCIDQRGLEPTQVCVRQYRTHDGRLIDVDLIMIALDDGNVLTIARDVTALMEAAHARDQLLEAERRARAEADRERRLFRALLVGAPGLFLVIEPPDYRIVEVSDAYLRATMTNRDDIIGRLLFDVFPDDPEDPRANGTRNLRESLERVAERGRVDAMALQRYPVRRPESTGGGFEERFWSVINAPVRDDSGRITLIIHRVEDVTAYVRTLGRREDGTDADSVDRSTLALAAEALARANEVQELNRQLEDRDRLLAIAGRTARIGGWTVDLETKTQEWSDEVCALHDVPPGTSPTLEKGIEYYVPEYRPIIRAHFQRCATMGTPYDLELELESASGRRMWVRAIGEAVRDEHDRIVRVQGAFQDISASKASQAEVARMANRLSSALDSMTDAFFTLNREWNFTYLNRQAEVLLQRTRESLLGRCIWNEFPEARGDVFETEYRRTVDTGKPASFTAYFAPLGGWFDIRAFASPEGLAVYFRNVTAVHEAQARLVEQASLLDQASDAIIVKTLEGRITYCNRGAARMYGLESPDDIVGSTSAEMEYGPVLPAAAKNHVLKHGEWVGELDQRRRDGASITVQSHLTLVRDANGAPSRILSINTDITEHKKLRAQLLQAQRLESIGTLAGGIAHDLNNVLTPIIMSIGILKEDATDAETRHILGTIEECANRGTGLVRQVLTFARGVEGIRINIDLRRIVRDVGRIIRETFPKNIVLTTNVQADLWPLRGDPTHVHQVLLNLCVNARDAMPQGGTLSIAVENVAVDETYAAMTPTLAPGPHIRIVVEDSGVGIPRAVIDRIFDPFFTTKPVGEGTGLGLSTVASIVREFGGHVSVYSEPGRGTSFRILLPSSTPSEFEESNAPVDESRMLPRGDGQLILVVDDEDSIRTITSETLTRFGYRVITAVDGAEAVAIYARRGEEIDLVLTDMRMPVMDGRATVHALIRLNPTVRIIAASGMEAGWVESPTKKGGIRRFLEKPYSAVRLLEAVHAVLTEERATSLA